VGGKRNHVADKRGEELSKGGRAALRIAVETHGENRQSIQKSSTRSTLETLIAFGAFALAFAVAATIFYKLPSA
jgi:hypothetical protein